jgi:hypothetical protein
MTSPGARKVKNYRARQRAGLAVLKVTVRHYDLVQMLIEAGRMTAEEALDRRRLEHVLAEAVDHWIKRWRDEKKV